MWCHVHLLLSAYCVSLPLLTLSTGIQSGCLKHAQFFATSVLTRGWQTLAHGPHARFECFGSKEWVLFQMVEKGFKRRIIFCDLWKSCEIKIFRATKFYWNTATLIHLWIVCGCFCIMATEWSSWDRDCVPAGLKIFTLTVREKFADPWS